LENAVSKIRLFAHTAANVIMPDDNERRIDQLQDEIKQRDRRIVELREEIDDLRDLVRRMEENVEDADNTIERWAETFGMVLTDDGWTWKLFWEEHNQIIDEYNNLVARWNRFVPMLNLQNVGRPLAASEAQCVRVLKLRKLGMSLRGIAEETNLGLATVRTIIDKQHRNDRTAKRHRARIEPDRQRLARWKRQRRTGDSLPKQAQSVVDDGRALITEAKGLGRR
jgi:hypothetical protein